MSNTLAQLKELSNEELRVRVAECFGLGCQAFKEEYDEQHDRSSCQDYFTYYAIPNYPEDLNTIAEVEKMLSDEEMFSYLDTLSELVTGVHPCRVGMITDNTACRVIVSSARLRAIAFVFVRQSLG